MENTVSDEDTALETSSWRWLKSEDGSELIETALVMPVFFLMIFGFIIFMMIMFAACNITYASRLAVRYACVHSNTSYGYTNDAAVSTSINNLINPFLFQYPSNTHTTTITYYAGVNSVTAPVGVQITLTYNITLPGYTYHGLQVSSFAGGIISQ